MQSTTTQDRLHELIAEFELHLQTYSRAEELAGLGSFQYNLHTQEHTFSDNFYRILGYEPRLFSLTPENILNLVHSDDRTVLLNVFEKFQHQRGHDDVNIRISRPDGKQRILKITARLHATQQGEDIVQGIAQDITRQKRNENDLRRSNENLAVQNQTFELAERVSHLGHWRWNLDTDERTFSDNLYRIHKLEPGADREAFLALTHADDLARVNDANEKLRTHQNGMELEYRVVTTDGETRHLAMRSKYIVTESGERLLVGTTQDITAQKKAGEEILTLKDEIAQHAEDKYRSVFESIDEGFTVQELVFDESGNAVDVIYREINKAFEKHTGLKIAVDKKASELFPNFEPWWFDSMVRVCKTGEPVRTEGHQADVNRWYTLQYSRVGGPGSKLVAAVFQDITESKRREQQQAFLLKFSDAMRTETTADAIANRALRMLSEELLLDRCYVGVYKLAEDRGEFPYQFGNDRVPPMPDGVRLSHFPEAVRVALDKTLVINDVAEAEGLADADRQNLGALGLRALVSASLRHGESNPIWSIVAVSASPRRWTQSEISLIEDITERTWNAMERARSEELLRQLENKYRSIFNSIDQGFAVIELVYNEEGKALDFMFVEVNRVFENQTGIVKAVGKRIMEISPATELYWVEQYQKVAETGISLNFENYTAHNNHWYAVSAVCLGKAPSRLVSVLFDDITERKRAEANLAFLAEVRGDLVALTDVDETMNVLGARIGAHFRASQCVFGEVSDDGQSVTVTHEWKSAKAPSLKGTYRVTDYATGEYLRACEAGEPFIVRDVTADQRVNAAQMTALGIGGFVTLPLVRDGAFRFNLNIYDSAPRDWTADEIELIRELTTRIWTRLERARVEEAVHELNQTLEAKVTERTRELAESKQHVERILNTLPNTVFIFDPVDQRNLFANPEVFHLLGYTPEEMKALGSGVLTRLIHPDDWAKEQAKRVQGLPSMQEGEVDESTYRVKHKDGTWRWVDVRRTVFQRDENGNARQILAVLHDITALKQAEDALVESKRQLAERKRYLEAILDNSVDMITAADRHLRVTVWNKRAEEQYGLSRNDVIGKSSVEFFPQLHAVEYDALVERVLNGEHVHVPEGKSINGRETFYEMHLVPLWNGEENPVGVLSIVRDITQRKKANDEITKNLTLLQQTEDIAQIGSWDYDVATKAFLWSDGMYRMFNLPAGMPVQPDVYVAQAVDEHKAIAQHISNALQHTWQPFDEVLSIHHNGTDRTIKVKGNPVFDKDGNVVKMLGVDIDISEQLKAEKAIADYVHFIEQITFTSPDIIFVMNLQTRRLVYSNGSVALAVGFTKEEADAMENPMLDIVHPDDMEAVFANIKEVFDYRDSEVQEFEYRVIDVNGKARWFRDRCAVFSRDADGVPVEKVSFTHEITSEKEASDQLQRSERELAQRTRYLELLMDNTVDAIGAWDMNLNCTMWNAASERAFGLTRDQVVGNFLFDLFPALNNDEVNGFIDDAMSGKIVHVPNMPSPLDADVINEVYMVPIREGNRQDGIMIFLRDVTPEFELKKQLAERRKFMESLLEHNVDRVYAFDANLVFTAWNKKCEEVYGLSKDAAVGKHVFDVFPNLENHFVGECYERAANGAFIHLPVMKGINSPGYLEMFLIPLHDDNGAVSGVLGIAHDLTEVVALRNELTERNQFLESLIDNSVDRVFAIDKEGRLTAWNMLCELKYDAKREDVLGKPLFDVLPHYRVFPLTALVERVLHGEFIHVPEQRLPNEDGYFELFMVPLKDNDGNPNGLLHIVHDITERKAVEQKLSTVNTDLQLSNRELTRRNDELSTFAFVAGHDLREPLRKIQTFLSVLMNRETLHLTARGQDYMARTVSASNRMDKLLEDLLAYTELNDKQEQPVASDLNMLFNGALADFSAAIQQHSITVRADKLPSIPVVPQQFRKLMHHLLSNAIKFRKADVPAQVRVSWESVPGDWVNVPELRRDSNYIRIIVTDNGIGFNPEDSKRVFELFTRLERDGDYPGTGLGLAICRKIIENHNGAIIAESTPGRGSTFTVYLPL